jgi:hypothetical protein
MPYHLLAYPSVQWLKVQGSRVQSSEVQRLKIQGSGFEVQGLGFRVLAAGSWLFVAQSSALSLPRRSFSEGGSSVLFFKHATRNPQHGTFEA